MANSYGSMKKKPIGKMILFGIVSLSFYALLLVKQDIVNDFFARGGIYAFLPIAAAFIFSFVHGSFTGKFWTVLGIVAARKPGSPKNQKIFRGDSMEVK